MYLILSTWTVEQNIKGRDSISEYISKHLIFNNKQNSLLSPSCQAGLPFGVNIRADVLNPYKITFCFVYHATLFISITRYTIHFIVVNNYVCDCSEWISGITSKGKLSGFLTFSLSQLKKQIL